MHGSESNRKAPHNSETHMTFEGQRVHSLKDRSRSVKGRRLDEPEGRSATRIHSFVNGTALLTTQVDGLTNATRGTRESVPGHRVSP